MPVSNGLFQPVSPMEPVPAETVPTGEEYVHQVKWDGVRIIAHVSGHNLLLHNRKLRERTSHYPELAVLCDRIKESAVLDGEVIVLRGGKPSFPLVLKRDLPGGGSSVSISRLVKSIPVTYMVFDLLYWGGKNLTGWPLQDRQDKLRSVLSADERVSLTENFADGPGLFSAIRERRMEGIVSKEADSRYYCGKKHPSWLKIKVRLEQLAVVCGYTVRHGRINALLMGAYHEGRLLYIGRVASGLKERDLELLTPFLSSSCRSTSPFGKVKSPEGTCWVEPRLTALLSFQEWTEELRMRSPVIKGFTADSPGDCIIQ